MKKCALATVPLVVLVLISMGMASKKTETPPSVAAAPAAAEESLWVAREDGSKQCEGGATAIDVASSEAQSAGIKVLESKKMSDDMMHMSVCGASTGKLNAIRIPRSDLEKARKLGFQAVNSSQ